MKFHPSKVRWNFTLGQNFPYNQPLTDNVYEGNNLYNVGLTHLVHPQVSKIELKAKYVSNKQTFVK